jgi:hypothetical protein
MKDERQGASNAWRKDRCVISAHFGSVLSVASVPHKRTHDRSPVHCFFVHLMSELGRPPRDAHAVDSLATWFVDSLPTFE